MGKRVEDGEVVAALEDSPWERMRREAEDVDESGVRRRLCAHCRRRPAGEDGFCGEFCAVADELRER